nr:MAG TPA: hypothetical protein [Caudoviricetes sp.]
MSKVIITKEQAEFIEGFKREWYTDNSVSVKIGEELPMWAGQALHNLMQFGFGHPLLNADDKEMSDDEVDPEGNFQHNQVPKLIEAIINGYETETEKNVVLFMEFSDGESENRKLYYGAGIHVTNKISATYYDLFIEWEAKKVEELKKQGWEVEEV